MPYASITGQSNVVSRSAITVGGSEADDERTKRRWLRSITSFWRPARLSTIWCIVGTAVYQLGWVSSIQAKNLKASKPGDVTTEAPARQRRQQRRHEAVDVEQRHDVQAPVGSASAPASRGCCRRRPHRLLWVNGTIFGRAVVPEVCSTIATSSGSA